MFVLLILTYENSYSYSIFLFEISTYLLFNWLPPGAVYNSLKDSPYFLNLP